MYVATHRGGKGHITPSLWLLEVVINPSPLPIYLIISCKKNTIFFREGDGGGMTTLRDRLTKKYIKKHFLPA